MPVAVPDDTLRKLAAAQPAELWRLGLGRAVIERFIPFSETRALVALRDDTDSLPALDLMLVDVTSGKVLWRQPRNQKVDKRLAAEESTFEPLIAREDELVFQIRGSEASALVALDPRTGGQKWISGASTRLVPVGETGVAIAEDFDPSDLGKGTIKIAAVKLADGAQLWNRQFTSKTRRRIHTPIGSGPDLLLFYGAPKKVGADGQTRWSRADITLHASGPQPQSEGADLMLVDARNKLLALDRNMGATRWSASLPEGRAYTSISPGNDVVYVRTAPEIPEPHGRKQEPLLLEPGNEPSYGLLAFQRKDGKPLWENTGPDPLVSNILESDGRVFFATPVAVVCLDASSGRQLFRTPVSTRANEFPVQLRRYDDRVVYIGELTIAAVSATGKKLYGWEFEPISAETEMHGLDEVQRAWDCYLHRAEQKMFKSKALMSFPETSGEEESRRQYQDALARATTGSMRAQDIFWGRGIYAYLSGPGSSYALFTYVYGMAVAQSVAQDILAAHYQPQARRIGMMRSSILSSYGISGRGDYVWRPHAKGGLLHVDIIHLPTGRHRERVLGPNYRNYGLWSMVDLDRGVVYSHTVGLDPAQHQFAAPHGEFRMGLRADKVQVLKSFLIAAPIEIPK